MEERQIHPVLYLGKIGFSNACGVDIGSLEGRKGTTAVIAGVPVARGTYECYYAIREDGKAIGAMMIVHETYGGEVLETSEKIGEFTVGLSNVVGFFASPKTEYTLNQLADYVKKLETEHEGHIWHVLNSRQFMAPACQAAATFVSAYAHRNQDGYVDAIQIEFNREESALLGKGGQING